MTYGGDAEKAPYPFYGYKKNTCLIMDFRFYDQLVKMTAFSCLIFVCVHHSGRHLYKMHLHMLKRKHARAKSL